MAYENYERLLCSGRQLDFVAVGIFEKGNRVAVAPVFHRTRLAHDLDAFGAKLFAGFVNIGHAKRDMTEPIADIIGVRVPVVGQLDDRIGLFRTIADEDIGKAAGLVVSFLSELHAEAVAIEFQTLIEIIYANHRVDDFHKFSPSREIFGVADF